MFLYSKDILTNEVMSKKFIIINQECKINEVVEIMLKNNLREVFVSDEHRNLNGVLTYIDIAKMKNKKGYEKVSLRECKMAKVVSVKLDTSLLECRDIMIQNNIGRLPVVEEGKLIGVIRKNEIFSYLYKTIENSSIKLDNILNFVHEAICVINAEGIVLLWNKRSEKLYGVSQKQILGKHIKNIFPNALALKVLKTRESYENVNHEPKKGYHMLINASPIWIDGKFAGAVSTDRDITKVKKLSSELHMANETLRFLEGEVKRYSKNHFGSVIGISEQITSKIETARQVAKTKATVLVTGESGTGKEVFSRAIHDYSGEKGLFIPVNCSAIPNGLFESEFFGYEQGAFTGANKNGKIGFFEMAEGGTIFLDEIGDMPLFMQAKLLRVLQEKQIIRVGGNKYIPINTRVISATNKDLKQMVEEEKFREDLYYRINVVEINLPPLRERRGDIPLLIDAFLTELSKKNSKNVPEIDKEVMRIILNYQWKGNIRELKNTMENLIVLAKDDIISMDLIPSYMIKEVGKKNIRTNSSLDLNESIKKLETDLIKEALSLSKGNKAKAAKLLNIPRATLYYKIENYEI